MKLLAFFTIIFLASCSPAIYQQAETTKIGRAVAVPNYTATTESGNYVYSLNTRFEANKTTGEKIPGVVELEKIDRYSYRVVISPIYNQRDVLYKAARSLQKANN